VLLLQKEKEIFAKQIERKIEKEREREEKSRPFVFAFSLSLLFEDADLSEGRVYLSETSREGIRTAKEKNREG
jgi:hypothetical protein